MALVLVIGTVLTLAGLVLLLNLVGAGDYVIRAVTSKDLGSLPPGFAASKRGFRTYATLLIALGLVCLGLGIAERVVSLGAGLIVIGALIFAVASVVAITGEVATVRKTKT